MLCAFLSHPAAFALLCAPLRSILPTWSLIRRSNNNIINNRILGENNSKIDKQNNTFLNHLIFFFHFSSLRLLSPSVTLFDLPFIWTAIVHPAYQYYSTVLQFNLSLAVLRLTSFLLLPTFFTREWRNFSSLFRTEHSRSIPGQRVVSSFLSFLCLVSRFWHSHSHAFVDFRSRSVLISCQPISLSLTPHCHYITNNYSTNEQKQQTTNTDNGKRYNDGQNNQP